MKKRLMFLMVSVVAIITTLSTAASAAINSVSSPVQKTYAHSSFVYHNSSMRIQNTGWGGIYIIEFDATLPEATSGAKYTQDFNWTGKTDLGSTINGISHSSTIAAASQDDGYIWKWTSGSDTIILETGVQYHFVICVDLFNKNHSWEIVREGVVIGSAYEQAFRDIPSSEITSSIMCQDLRFGNSWKVTVNETSGQWGDTKPQNVKITKSAVFAGQKPTITVTNGKVTADVSVYHNVTSEVFSPVLMLCVYDANGTMIDISANRLSFAEKTSTDPVKATLKTTLNTELKNGMTIKAMLIESFSNRFTAIESTEQIYSVE